ncbi:F-box/kelch-repeat protein At3g23880-like isoform X2 [Silene latifolia]|uniref:F-box/kelch-repeat protein At3g23880-like isoform X2 n=1 Tax=Silene latifolia TaxID=37657 RepID=UPI003D782899
MHIFLIWSMLYLILDRSASRNNVFIYQIHCLHKMESQSKDDEDPIQQTELPIDLISEMILTRLPIKSVFRFKSVSKLWYSTLSSSRFAFTHHKFSNPSSTTQSLLIRKSNKFQIMSHENGQIDLVKVEVDFDLGDENMVLVGTCNGLVGLGSTSGSLFIVWNPITGEFCKYLDPEISDFTTGGCMVTWGFGYVSAVDDYKFVRLCKKVFMESIRVHVYSTRFDKMKRIDNDTSDNFFGLKIAERLHRPGVLVNETVYWMGGVPPMLDGLPRKILSFDLASEIFDIFPHLEVSTPSSTCDTDKDECFDELLCVANGCLSKYGRRVTSGEDVITVLKSPGEKEEIVLSKNLADWMYDNLIGSAGGDKIFTQYYGDSALRLGVFDLTSQPLKHTLLMILDRGPKIEIVSYCASLISLNAYAIETPETHKDEVSNI